VDGLLRRLSEHHFARIGLSPAQWGVLRSLDRLEEQGRHKPRMHELGAVLLVQPPSLSATLDRMERAGWVRRRRDAHDKRSRLIGLSPAGRALLKTGLRDHEQWVARVMGGLEAPEQAQLRALLAKLGGHLGGLVEGLRERERPAAAGAPARGRRQRTKA
jgi:DNA-binding MarR family transcriptional regulator